MEEIGKVDSPLCRCSEAEEELTHVLFECGANEKWTKKMFSELIDKIEFPTNAEILLIKAQEQEEIAKVLHRFLIRANLNV